MLAVKALIALYDPNEQGKFRLSLDFDFSHIFLGTEELGVGLCNPHLRANIASTLVRLNPNNDCTTSHSNELTGYEILRHLFGLGEWCQTSFLSVSNLTC